MLICEHIASTCGGGICTVADKFLLHEVTQHVLIQKGSEWSLAGNRKLPCVIQELQYSMCWGYSSPWHEELFSNYQIFSDAKWNSPTREGWRGGAPQGWQTHYTRPASYCWTDASEAYLELRKGDKYLKYGWNSALQPCQMSLLGQDPPAFCGYSACAHHTRSCILVGHLGSCSCILTQRGFVQGAVLLSGQLVLM